MVLNGTCEAMVREARLLDRQGRLPAAIAAYQSLLARWPALPDCWYSLALLQRKTRQFSAAPLCNADGASSMGFWRNCELQRRRVAFSVVHPASVAPVCYLGLVPVL